MEKKKHLRAHYTEYKEENYTQIELIVTIIKQNVMKKNCMSVNFFRNFELYHVLTYAPLLA